MHYLKDALGIGRISAKFVFFDGGRRGPFSELAGQLVMTGRRRARKDFKNAGRIVLRAKGFHRISRKNFEPSVKRLSRGSYLFRPSDYHILEPIRVFNVRRKVIAGAGPAKSQSAVAEHPAYDRLVDFDCFNFD